jgi:signal transduction histidine kinase
MKLQYKFVELLSIFALILYAVVCVALYIILMHNSGLQEEQQYLSDINRFQGAFAEKTAGIEVLTNDWSMWDEMYSFALQENPGFEENYISFEQLSSPVIDLIIIMNNTNDALVSKQLDYSNMNVFDINSSLRDGIISVIEAQREDNTYASGIIVIDNIPMILVARPILRNDGKLIAPAGTLVMVQLISDEKVQVLSSTIKNQLELHLYDDPKTGTMLRSSKRIDTMKYREDTPTTSRLHIVSTDVFGEPSVVFTITANRDLYIETKNTLRVISISIAVLLIIFVLLATRLGSVTFRKTREQIEVLKRTTEGILHDDFSHQYPAPTDDEMGDLIRCLESMRKLFIKKDGEVAAAHIKLEQKINERTDELTQKVDEMERYKTAILNIMEDLQLSMNKQKNLEKVKTEFLSVTSHELRTPITPMNGQIEMLLGEFFGKLNDEQRKSLEMIQRNTLRLDRLIGDILDISKLESGNLKFIMKQGDLKETLDHAIETMRFKASEKNIVIRFNSVPVPAMTFDKDRITQVITNLVNNAIKFTDPNGTITVDLADLKDRAKITVTDTGIGISKEDAARLFTPFTQVDSSVSRNFEGSGLGLAICKGIVKSHNGDIWIESEIGKGSSFIFTVAYQLAAKKAVVELFSAGKGEALKKFKEVLSKEGLEIAPNKEQELLAANVLDATGNLHTEITYAYLEEKRLIQKRGVL